MKELSIEEKAHRYDEAIKEAVIAHKDEDKHLKATLERIFPELKESEDERIRKDILQFVKNWLKGEFPKYTTNEEECNAMITWLEEQRYSEFELENEYWRGYDDGKKQGKKKPTDKVEPIFNVGDKIQYLKGCGTIMTIEKIENGEYIFANNMGHTIIESGNEWYLVEQKPTDKIDPKFKEGDWIVWQDKCYKVNYNGCGYELVDKNGFRTSLEYGTIDENAHLWDITKDAKEGDVLVHNNCTFIFMGIKNGIVQAVEEKFLEPVSFGESDKDDYHPATKEQRDLLFSKLKEAGYEWDTEKKELHKLSNTELNEFDSKLCYILQQFRYKDSPITNGEIIDYVLEHGNELLSIVRKQVIEETCKWIETIPTFNNRTYPIDKNKTINSSLLIESYKKALEKGE